MVVARPTSRWDLDRVRMHAWNGTTTCARCGLEITADLVLADLPGCPGPLFRLTFLGRPKHAGRPDFDEAAYPEGFRPRHRDCDGRVCCRPLGAGPNRIKPHSPCCVKEHAGRTDD